jgi:2'-5' RNA ligase
VTLKFLGATWPRLLDEVRAAVAEVATGATAFESRVTELGVFPSSRRAQVIWAGLEDTGGRFAAMSEDLDQRLEDSFVPVGRAFTAHLTLARLNPPRELSEFDPDLVGTRVDSAPFAVDSLVLYRSRVSPTGARYEALERFPFSTTPGA